MSDQLKEQIKVVVEARQEATVADAALSMARTQWEFENKTLIERKVVASQVVSEAEMRLRELTLEAYAQTGNKTPAIGVGIREVTKLEYDKKSAFDWAVEHTMALKLDTSGFEKIVKVSPPDFVKVYLGPQATIATQLEVRE